MTTGTPPEPPAGALRRWAAERLELPADVPSKEARAAFMQRLRDEDFMPPASWQQASGALLLNRASESLRADVFTAEEAQLRGEVESFAVGFFSLEVDAREKRWFDLRELCLFSPALRARLLALEPGLRVPAESNLENPNQRELAGYVRELFLLRPKARAFRRQQLFEQITPEDRERLGFAARQFLSSHPAIIALERDFISQLESWKHRDRKRQEIRKNRTTCNTIPSVTPAATQNPEDVKHRAATILAFLFLFVAFAALFVQSEAWKVPPGTRTLDFPVPMRPPIRISTPDYSVPVRPPIDFDARMKNQGDLPDLLQNVPMGKRPRFVTDDFKDVAVGVEETAKKLDELRQKILNSNPKMPVPDSRP